MKRLSIATLAAIPVVLAAVLAAAQGGETATRSAAAPSSITICHKTGSASNPWRRTTVSSRAMNNPKSRSGKLLRGHLRHTGDAIVAGAAACPAATVTPAPTSTPPARIAICHKTGSATNPYRRIMVSSRAVTNPRSTSGRILRGHMGHTGDLMLPGATTCPPGTQQNQGVRLTATLAPVQGATGSGTAAITARVGAGTLCYTLTVSGLTDITAAHIHRVSPEAVVVPLNTPTTGTSSGCATVDKDLIREIIGNPGAFYVNVHTSSYPNGQVQGRLTR